MCIISIKESNQRKWNMSEIEHMMKVNPDGAGFMYLDKMLKSVKIEKGFFSPSKAFKFLSKLPDDVPIIFHARIATHGATGQALCHPFPLYGLDESVYLIDSDMTKPRNACTIGLAHNGILKIAPENRLSDTATFCKYINNHFDIAQLPYLWELLAGSDVLNDSRLVTLDSNGNIKKLGRWYQSEGFYYSNWGYPKSWKSNFTSYPYDITPAGGKAFYRSLYDDGILWD